MAAEIRAGLIGHTGFVGGTLARQASFDASYHSKTIEAIAGERFGLLVCAGVSAVKWQANRDPAADQAGIDRLTAALAQVVARELVLISTIDVYPDPASGGDEATAIDPSGNHAYGRHRLALEQWCRNRFDRVLVVRLPALFGVGLRKNAVFDLLHGHMLGNINPAAAFQWYPLARLWADIAVARQAGLDLVNLFPEPLPMQAIVDAVFPGAPVGPAIAPAPRYALQTQHGRLFGGDGRYMMDAAASLEALCRFVKEFRS
jgi:hypothetical protein